MAGSIAQVRYPLGLHAKPQRSVDVLGACIMSGDVENGQRLSAGRGHPIHLFQKPCDDCLTDAFSAKRFFDGDMHKSDLTLFRRLDDGLGTQAANGDGNPAKRTEATDELLYGGNRIFESLASVEQGANRDDDTVKQADGMTAVSEFAFFMLEGIFKKS